MSSSVKLRPTKKTPIFVEEDHNEVLRHIFRCVGSKLLPVSGNIMVHFDSHPDLALPFRLNHQDTEVISDLYDKISIESWILPATYLGVIDTVLWICPPWAHQIPKGEHKFSIGKHKETGQILTTCSESYFLSEGITCNKEDLANVKDVTLIVFRLDYEMCDVDQSKLDSVIKIINSSNYILDVDLDFYSTKNPFLDLFPKANLYAKLKEIYTFESIPSHLTDPEQRKQFAIQSCAKRNELLDKMIDLTNYLQKHRSVKGYTGIGLDYCEQFDEIQNSIVAEYGTEADIDWPIVHNAGCTCDDTELPHHVSTQAEISSLLKTSQKFLEALGGKIAVVTIARSSLDDFCPQDQVDHIQSSVIQIVSGLLGGEDKAEVKICYEDQ